LNDKIYRLCEENEGLERSEEPKAFDDQAKMEAERIEELRGLK